MSNGSKPWTRISEHLYNTGNTYVLISHDDKAFLVMDPWDPHSAAQIVNGRTVQSAHGCAPDWPATTGIFIHRSNRVRSATASCGMGKLWMAKAACRSSHLIATPVS